jgi:hypothetical protein
MCRAGVPQRLDREVGALAVSYPLSQLRAGELDHLLIRRSVRPAEQQGNE